MGTKRNRIVGYTAYYYDPKNRQLAKMPDRYRTRGLAEGEAVRTNVKAAHPGEWFRVDPVIESFDPDKEGALWK